MASSSIDTMQIPFECPQCRKQTKKRLRDLQPNSKFSCAGCGAKITVSGDEFQRVRKAALDLQKQVSKLSTTIKIKL